MIRKQLLLILSSLLLGVSCTPDLGANCESGKCDNDKGGKDGQDAPCDQIIEDFSGNDLSIEQVMGLKDGVAELVLSSTGNCSISVADMVQKLTEGGCDGLGTALVSSRSQSLNVYTDYRTVTDMNCKDSEGADRQVFLHYPLPASQVSTDQQIDQDKLLEKLDSSFPAIIAQASDGSFNYYQALTHQADGGVCVPTNESPSDEEIDSLPQCTETSDCNPGVAEGEIGPNTCHTVGKVTVSSVRYFGNSIDYISQKDRHETLSLVSAALPVAGAQETDVEHTLEIDRNCASCHPNGGILIKEFDTPWVHWEGHENNPQTGDIISQGNLGRANTGATVESRVRAGNQRWNNNRIGQVLKGLSEGGQNLTTGDLLRPLLCTDEFNIDTATDFRGRTMSKLALAKAVTDRALGRSLSVNVDEADFEAEIARQGWILGGYLKVPALQALLKALGLPDFGKPVEALGGLIVPRETIFKHTFMERSQIDIDYQDKLVAAGVINEKLLNALLSIDHTRGLFSEDRCGLVDVMAQANPANFVSAFENGEFVEAGGSSFNPTVTAVSGTADRLNTEILRVLTDELGRTGCSGSQCDPEDELVDLLSQSQPVNLSTLGSNFANACKARPQAEFLTNYVRYLTNLRHRAAGLNAGATQVKEKAVEEIKDASFLQFRFPGENGFVMSHAIDQTGLLGFEPGLKFNDDCTMD